MRAAALRFAVSLFVIVAADCQPSSDATVARHAGHAPPSLGARAADDTMASDPAPTTAADASTVNASANESDAGTTAPDHMTHMEDVRRMVREKLGSRYDEPVRALAAADVARGKSLYVTKCAPCHGVSGKGDGAMATQLSAAPSDHTDVEHTKFYSDQARLWIVRRGIPGTPMPAFLQELGEQGTLQTFAYTRSLAQAAGKGRARSHTHDHSESKPHKH